MFVSVQCRREFRCSVDSYLLKIGCSIVVISRRICFCNFLACFDTGTDMAFGSFSIMEMFKKYSCLKSQLMLCLTGIISSVMLYTTPSSECILDCLLLILRRSAFILLPPKEIPKIFKDCPNDTEDCLWF